MTSEFRIVTRRTVFDYYIEKKVGGDLGDIVTTALERLTKKESNEMHFLKGNKTKIKRRKSMIP